MDSPKESTSSKNIIKKLRQRKFWANKRHGSQFTRKGLPDIEAIRHGYSFNFEDKKRGEEPDPCQVLEIKKIRDAGGIACVVYGWREVEEIVEAFEEHGYDFARSVAMKFDYRVDGKNTGWDYDD